MENFSALIDELYPLSPAAAYPADIVMLPPPDVFPNPTAATDVDQDHADILDEMFKGLSPFADQVADQGLTSDLDAILDELMPLGKTAAAPDQLQQEIAGQASGAVLFPYDDGQQSPADYIVNLLKFAGNNRSLAFVQDLVQENDRKSAELHSLKQELRRLRAETPASSSSSSSSSSPSAASASRRTGAKKRKIVFEESEDEGNAEDQQPRDDEVVFVGRYRRCTQTGCKYKEPVPRSNFRRHYRRKHKKVEYDRDTAKTLPQ